MLEEAVVDLVAGAVTAEQPSPVPVDISLAHCTCGSTIPRIRRSLPASGQSCSWDRLGCPRKRLGEHGVLLYPKAAGLPRSLLARLLCILWIALSGSL